MHCERKELWRIKLTTLPPVRWDLPYTQEVVTPHLKWADPYVNGPIRAFFVNGMRDGRVVAELAQRLTMETRVVTIDREFSENRFWNPRYQNERSVWSMPQDYSFYLELLEEELARDVSYDVIMMHSVLGWNAIQESLRKLIYARVKRGEGLVLIQPQLGEKTEDKKLWELSPLINVPSSKLGHRARDPASARGDVRRAVAPGGRSLRRERRSLRGLPVSGAAALPL